MTTSELRERMVLAFAAGVRPATADEIATPTENPYFSELAGKAWHEVPTETVFLLRWDLEAFTRRGFRHYLPALLLLALEEPDVAEPLTTYLMRTMSYRDAPWPSEKDAVRAVLRHQRDSGDSGAAEALATYWEDFPVSPRDVECERLGRALLEVFPLEGDRGDGSWADRNLHVLAVADARDMVARETNELRDELPAHLLALVEGEPTWITYFLSPSWTPDRARLDALARTLSPRQARLVGDLLVFARRDASPYPGEDAADDAYWDQLASAGDPAPELST